MLRTLTARAALILSTLLAPAVPLFATTYAESTLHTFTGGDGSEPHAMIQAADGNFYGTAVNGGIGSCGSDPGQADNQVIGCGIVFRLTPAGVYTVLYSFQGGNDGANPLYLTQGSDGALYGIAGQGGGSLNCETDPANESAMDNVRVGCGTIFRLTLSGTYTQLYAFTGYYNAGYPDGAYSTPLIQGTDGYMYATTAAAGLYGYGTVYKFPLTSTPFSALTQIYSFTGGSDGAYPNGIIQAGDGNFYGTTQDANVTANCPGAGCGTVFKINPNLNTVLNLYNFTGMADGAELRAGDTLPRSVALPRKGSGGFPIRDLGQLLPVNATTITRTLEDFGPILIEAGDGSFYGNTLPFPNPNGINGTIFNLNLSSSTPLLTTEYSFKGSNDGVGSQSGITAYGTDGLLYGTSGNVLFNTTGTPGNLSVLYTFTGQSDGAQPWRLIQGADGNFYGNAKSAGVLTDCLSAGCGTLYKLTVSPALPGPVQVSIAATDTVGTPTTLTWKDYYAYSATSQQCYAFQEGAQTGGGTWTGLQTGIGIIGALAGTATITPTAPGTYTYALTCAGKNSGWATMSVPALAISSTVFNTTAHTNTAYTSTLSPLNGVGPYTWTIKSGALPPGITLASSTGVLSGTPTQGGTYPFTLQVTDSELVPLTAVSNLSLTVLITPPTVATTSVPGGTVGSSYTTTLSAINGTTPYTWAIKTGTLPPGLTLAAGTGVISGTPTQAGSYAVTIQVTDAEATPVTASAALVFTVVIPPPVITTPTLAGGYVGAPYTTTLGAASGTAPYTWSIKSGVLPPGLTLVAGTGVLSGTPTQSGNYAFTIQVADSESTPVTASANLTLTVITPVSP